MTSENDPGFSTEQIYKQLSRYPSKAILIPALKVGALTGKRLAFTDIHLRFQIRSEKSGKFDSRVQDSSQSYQFLDALKLSGSSLIIVCKIYIPILL